MPDDATMHCLNGEVDVQKKSIEDVATGYLKEKGVVVILGREHSFGIYLW